MMFFVVLTKMASARGRVSLAGVFMHLPLLQKRHGQPRQPWRVRSIALAALARRKIAPAVWHQSQGGDSSRRFARNSRSTTARLRAILLRLLNKIWPIKLALSPANAAGADSAEHRISNLLFHSSRSRRRRGIVACGNGASHTEQARLRCFHGFHDSLQVLDVAFNSFNRCAQQFAAFVVLAKAIDQLRLASAQDGQRDAPRDAHVLILRVSLHFFARLIVESGLE